LMLDCKEMGKTTADEEGHWSFEINPNPGLADDNYSVEIIAMDEVGNISSSTYELVIDTVTSTPTIMLDAGCWMLILIPVLHIQMGLLKIRSHYSKV
ncbi:Ig-like domain-containing protein, partial [Rahnella perminowiae]|uniref:Ig-like domain-containing protein n=1 Tax=Rahnella perminowiae TaxID=2816244 RepID=UPI00224B0EDB